jgi:putative methyltransferase (TIGR04325 family)
VSHISRTQARRAIEVFTPPAMLQLGKEVRRRVLGRARPWEYVADDWPDGNSTEAPRGWDVTSIPRLHARHWQQFIEAVSGPNPLCVAPEHGVNDGITSGPYGDTDVYTHHTIMSAYHALAQAAWGRDALSVLDWGGGVGHYAVVIRSLFPQVTFDYSVKDVPAMVIEGRRLLPDVTFYDDDSECFQRRYDFVLASSSLQYVRDWQRGLGTLARATESHLYVSQVPVVHDAKSFVVMQRPYSHGYDTEYLGWCFQRRALLEVAHGAGLTLVREIVHGFKPDVHGAPEAPEYRGFLFRRSQ